MSPVFDRTLLRARRDRAAAQFAASRLLHEEVGARLLERLLEIRRTFPIAVNLGAQDGFLTAQLQGRDGAQQTVQLELSLKLAQRAAAHGPVAVADEEFLPLGPQSVHLIASALALHWVNDLPGCLIQCQRALKPDGLFLASVLGTDTLSELRRCLDDYFTTRSVA